MTDLASISQVKPREVRGRRSIYHNNAIQTWRVDGSGEVTNVQVL